MVMRNHHTLGVRLPVEAVARIDALVALLAEKAGGVALNRSDVMRVAIEKGLTALESEHAKPAKPSKQSRN